MISQQTRIISGLSEIASNYDALLCDAWGVIHNGVYLYPGVDTALTLFREQYGPVFVLTNAPRLSNVIPKQLDKLQLSRSAYDGVVTSGDATHYVLQSRTTQKAFCLGPSKDSTLFDALDISFTKMDEADFILCTGLFDDATETPEDYRDMLSDAHQKGLPMVCANPDIVVKRGNKIIYCGGALAQLYKQLGGEIILAGKPHPPIYKLAYEKLQNVDHAKKPAGQDPKRILVIGDGLTTDILGANNQNLDVLFIAEGIFSAQVRNDQNDLDATLLTKALAENKCHAQYGLDGLRW